MGGDETLDVNGADVSGAEMRSGEKPEADGDVHGVVASGCDFVVGTGHNDIYGAGTVMNFIVGASSSSWDVP